MDSSLPTSLKSPRRSLRPQRASLPPMYYPSTNSYSLDLESQQPPHQNHHHHQQQRVQAREAELQSNASSHIGAQSGPHSTLPTSSPNAALQFASQIPHYAPYTPAGPPRGAFPPPKANPPRSAPMTSTQSFNPSLSSHSGIPIHPVLIPPANAYSLSPQRPLPNQSPPHSALNLSYAANLPQLRPVRSASQLKPVVIKAPKTRRVKPEGGSMSPLIALTSYLSSTYAICDPQYQYSPAKNPRRVLTEPHEAKSNHGFDNQENDYILYVNDVLGTEENRRYLTLNLLGKGTFGQVVKCQNMATMEIVAVKVIKNKPAFLNQSRMEVTVLEHIQQNVDRQGKHNLLRLKDQFMHRGHLCLVLELLSLNLYEVIKKNEFRGLGIHVVRVFTQQLLDSLAALKSAGLVHCDLKPENVLLKRPDGLEIKVIDFGSACHERQTVYTYIQSRFYRSPEIILGLPYTSAIDMWSLGCIIAELFLGLPIFPGSSEYNQWTRIMASLGMPPQWMLDAGKNTGNFMVKTPQGGWRLRTIEEQNQTFNTKETEGRRYFTSSSIHETIMSYPLWNNNLSQSEIDDEMRERECLSDFVRGLINYNPLERWTPQQAAMHPFISRQKFMGPYSPQPMAAASAPMAFPGGKNQVLAPGPPSHLSGGRYPVMPQQTNSLRTSGSGSLPQIAVSRASKPLLPNNTTASASAAPYNTAQKPHRSAYNSSQASQNPNLFQNPINPPHSQAYNMGNAIGAAINNAMVSPSVAQLTPQHTPQFSAPANAPHISAHHINAHHVNAPHANAPPVNAPHMNTAHSNLASVNAQFGPRHLAPPMTSVRGRSATLGQVNSLVPAPIQQAASRVDPNQIIQGHDSPAYFPPRGFFPNT